MFLTSFYKHVPFIIYIVKSHKLLVCCTCIKKLLKQPEKKKKKKKSQINITHVYTYMYEPLSKNWT